MRRAIVALCLVALATALASCLAEPADTVTLGGQELHVFVADDERERSLGLEGYDELEPGQGMLFVFDDLAVRTFAMKEVSFPIDVVFVAEDLTVSAVAPLDPGSTDLVASPGPAPYVIELPQGWAAEQGIGVGSALAVPEEFGG